MNFRLRHMLAALVLVYEARPALNRRRFQFPAPAKNTN